MRTGASQCAHFRAPVNASLRQRCKQLFIGLVVISQCSIASGQSPAVEQDITFSRDVAPILFKRCSACHHAGAAGPFSLIFYEDAKKRARQIAEVVQSRYMPPWLPEPGRGDFTDSRRLTDDEIATIVQWVQQGAAEGNRADLPPSPQFSTDWLLGEPDMVVRLPEPYTLPAVGPDVFRNFVLPVHVPAARYVRAVEFRMDNPRVVHHANLKIDPRQTARRADARDPEPGFEGMDFVDADFPDGHILGWSPGRAPHHATDGLAWRLLKGSDLVLMLHMLPSGKPEVVQASIGLYFTDTPPARTPYSLRLGSQIINIPAGDAAHVIQDTYTVPVDADLTTIFPHAHYLAKNIEARATLPDGTEQWLLHIPRWDFNWQDEYRCAEPVRLPKGTKISVRLTYDNSASNAVNPHQPPRRVVYGPQSSDEMGDVWFQVLPRNPADLPALIADFKRKELGAEIAGFEHALQLQPDAYEVHASLAERYLVAGRVDDAVEHFKRSISLNPAFAGGHCNLGVILQMRNQPGPAMDHLRKAIQADPTYAEAHLNLGLALQSQGKHAEAMQSIRRSLELKPDLAAAHVAMANTLGRQGSIDQAAAHYRAALEITPDDSAVRNNLAAALLAKGDVTGAIREFQQALAVNPQQPEPHIGLGRALRLAGRHDEALRHFGEAIRLRADHPGSLTGAAWILATHPVAERRDPAQAVRLAERAAQLTQYRDPAALDVLAAAYAAAGSFDHAVQAEQAAIELARRANFTAAVAEYSQRLNRYQKSTPHIEVANVP